MNTTEISSDLIKWPKVILFGDSLTQYCYDPVDGKWGALLADRFQRICDVVNRGFSGYNTGFACKILPQIFSPENVSDIEAFVILLGSNDCSSNVESAEHPLVPLKNYKENLKIIIKYLQKIGISNDKIILMSPPPYCHKKYTAFCKEIGRELSFRDLKIVGQYASACAEISHELKIENLNLYQEMIKYESWPDYLKDGLHFGSSGSKLVYELLLPLIEKRINVTEMICPSWRDFS